MFVIELPVPFLIFLPAPFCCIAAASTIALMVAIMATGNSSFFNLLAIALSLLVLDDGVWRRIVPAIDASARRSEASPLVIGIAVVLVLLSIRPVVHLFARNLQWPKLLERLVGWCEPWHVVSGYRLFAVMTTARPEIIVKGSVGGREWRTYEFSWKPGDPARRPRWCMPHQPRLDWQMWFAALADYRMYPWFIAFLARVLENAPPVVRLLRSNPFPDSPPRYIRATLYRYRFTNLKRRQPGAWWDRDLLGLYCPALARKSAIVLPAPPLLKVQ
jgi:hypothetical protein